jgi:carbamoyl-phosphate synthase large subunit
MNVCYNEEELENFVGLASVLNTAHPVTVSKFISGAKELELDAVAQNGKVQVSAISEHIENAGVHSGDATIAYPPQKVYMATAHQVNEIAIKLAEKLHITGPFNIQFLVKDNKVFVIELNIRASRTFPFISKATGVNFADIVVASFYGKSKPTELPYPNHVVVKSPQFSFARLAGADPVLRVEMSSTGEVACFGATLEEALLKSLHSSVNLSNKKSTLLSIGGGANKERFLESALELANLGFQIYATGSTHVFLKNNGIKSIQVHKVYENRQPDVISLIETKSVAFVINISDSERATENKILKHVTDGFLIRRSAVDSNIPLFTDLQLAKSFVKALTSYSIDDLEIKSWKEYMKETK